MMFSFFFERARQELEGQVHEGASYEAVPVFFCFLTSLARPATSFTGE